MAEEGERQGRRKDEERVLSLVESLGLIITWTVIILLNLMVFLPLCLNVNADGKVV